MLNFNENKVTIRDAPDIRPDTGFHCGYPAGYPMKPHTGYPMRSDTRYPAGYPANVYLILFFHFSTISSREEVLV
jgi:hypothetical protein